jgi:hypothetical protein
MKSIFGFGKLWDSFLTMSRATPNVKDAPLPPAINITLSAHFAKFGTVP